MNTATPPTVTKWSLSAPLPPTGYVRLAELVNDPKKGKLGALGVCRSTFLAGLKKGRYQLHPVKLSARCVGYRVEEVRALIAELSGCEV